jgi:hypothetical protein
MIKNIQTTNVPLIDEMVFNLKKLAVSCVLKDENLALKYETLDTIKQSDIYIACIENRARFELFTYTAEIINKSSLPAYLKPLCIADNSLIPDISKSELLNIAITDFMANYVEKNNYYRMLSGQPNYGKQGIKITSDYLPPNILGIDITKHLHEMSLPEIDILYSIGIIDRVLIENPTEQYLKYMGARKVDIYTARKAINFSLLYVTKDAAPQVSRRFKTKIELNRVYTMKTIYSDAYKYGSDYYDNFIRVMIIIQSIVDVLSEIPDIIIKRDLFDLRMIKLMFESNGVEFFPEIPLKYQMAMIRNLNTLIKFKSTTRNIVDICSIFGFDNIQVFKYYLLKDRKKNKSTGKYEFNYKTIEDPNNPGQNITVQDDDLNFDLRFVKVPIDDIADNYINSNIHHLDYDDVVINDKYWNGDMKHEDVKSEIINRHFNYVQSKYISIDTVYDMTELSFELTYFFNMLFDNSEWEEELTVTIPAINGSTTFGFVDIICYLFALMYEYNNIADDIMTSMTRILDVKGFNFKADLAELGNYVAEQGFTLEELGVADFQIPDTSILTFNQLLYIYTKNKSIYNHIVTQLYKADNKKIYDIYKHLYDAMMITELTFDFFKKPDGNVAETYTDFLSERNTILYNSILEIRNIGSDKVKQEKISDIINNTVYALDEYIDDKEYKFFFSKLPSVSAEAVKEYIYKVVNFFKSYKTEIMSINTVYLFDDKLENKIKMIDEALMTNVYTKPDIVDIIIKSQMLINLSPKEVIEIVDKIYIDRTYWIDLFFNTDTNIQIQDRFANFNSIITKSDKFEIKDIISISYYY